LARALEKEKGDLRDMVFDAFLFSKTIQLKNWVTEQYFSELSRMFIK
jgi:hypothetical protein